MNNVDNEGNRLSQKQMAFFKNSKIVDYDGNLIVCRHGTNVSFKEFGKGDIGFHFGTEEAASQRIEDREIENGFILSCYLNITKPLEWYDIIDWTGCTFAWHILNNDFDFNNLNLTNEEQDMLQSVTCGANENIDNRNFTEKQCVEATKIVKDLLTKKGYDGIIYENEDEDAGSISYIAFFPEQIKLISNREPTNNKSIDEKKQRRCNNGKIYNRS